MEFELENLLDNKKRRISLINSEILQSSKLTSVHRSKDFLQIFSFVVRVNWITEEKIINQRKFFSF